MNYAEHRTALERIDALMDAKEGTPEGVELDALATKVMEYEMDIMRPRNRFEGWIYRAVMRLAHRYGWHYAPRMPMPHPTPAYQDGIDGVEVRHHFHWCHWCGLRGETLETILTASKGEKP
jgi:hypothetical protein